MNIRSIIKQYFWVFFLLLSSCATSHFGTGTVKQEALNTPDYFMVGFHENEEMREPKANEGCRSPMVDPRDGFKVYLVRSSESIGDYSVSGKEYGVGNDELLRIACNTGKAIGIVQR